MRSIWNPEAKLASCAGCPHEHEPCVVAENHEITAQVTFILLSPWNNSKTFDPVGDPRPQGRNWNDAARDIFDNITRRIQVQMHEEGSRRSMFQTLTMVNHIEKKPKKEVLDACAPWWQRRLTAHRKDFAMRSQNPDAPHVLIPMGAKPAQIFMTGAPALKSIRGKFAEWHHDGFKYLVMPTLSVQNVLAVPGTLDLVYDDVLQAFRKVYLPSALQSKGPSVEETIAGYTFPQTIEEVRQVCDEIIAYTVADKQPDPDKWPIAVDTETNTKYAHDPNATILAVSLGWDDGKATTIALDHSDTTYDVEEAWSHVVRVLHCPKPKVLQNAKFDLRMFQAVRGLEVINVWWDTMLGEHYLYEDRSGWYGLKDMADSYAPELRGYEEALRKSLRGGDEADTATAATFDTEVLLDPDTPLSDGFPLLIYAPLSEDPAALSLPIMDPKAKVSSWREVRLAEIEYLRAMVAGDSKKKSKQRTQVRNWAKKLGVDLPDNVKVRKAETESRSFADVPMSVLAPYAAIDADLTRRICKGQRKQMYLTNVSKDAENVRKNLLIPMTRSLARMEQRGVKIDQDKLERMDAEMLARKARAERELRELTTDPNLNPGSDKELGLLLEKGVIRVHPSDIVRTPGGAISVRAQWMQSILDSPRYAADFRTRAFFFWLLAYRACAKASGTFISNIRTLSRMDGRIHTSFNIHGTATSRLSSSGMNLQNIPKIMGRCNALIGPDGEVEGSACEGWNIKSLFVPSNPDRLFFQADISAAEIRVLCAYSRDPALIRAMCAGLDIHSFVLSTVDGIPYDEVVARKHEAGMSLRRTAMKRVLFGMLYGAAAPKCAEQIYGTPTPTSEQIDETQGVMDGIFAKFGGINDYIRMTHREVAEHGYVKTFFGRYRRFSASKSSFRLARAAEREAVNFKIQSTSSDLVMDGLVEIEPTIHEIDAEALLTVHDSIAGDICRSRVDELRPYLQEKIVDRCAEKFDWLPVPFLFDLETGESYGELY